MRKGSTFVGYHRRGYTDGFLCTPTNNRLMRDLPYWQKKQQVVRQRSEFLKRKFPTKSVPNNNWSTRHHYCCYHCCPHQLSYHHFSKNPIYCFDTN